MHAIHVNYPALDPDLFIESRPPWSVWFKLGLTLAIGLLMMLPLLVWYGWHLQWHALGVLGVLLLGVSLLVARRTTRDRAEEILRKMLPLEFCLLPEGLLINWGQEGYQFHVWAKLQAPVVDPLGMTLKNSDDEAFYWLPRQAFASDAQYQDFTAQAVQYHSAASPAAAEALPRFREPRLSPHYTFTYQLSLAEESSSAAKLELQKQAPQTLPEGEVTPNWKMWLYSLAFLATFFVLMYDLHDDAARTYKYTPLTFIMMGVNLGYLWVLLKLAMWLFPQWISSRKPSLISKVVTLNDRGFRVEQPGVETETPWPNIDALVQHEGKITLWHAGIIQALIPERVFNSPDETQICVEWMRERISNKNNVPTALLAEKYESNFPPDTNNPYQAPRY